MIFYFLLALMSRLIDTTVAHYSFCATIFLMRRNLDARMGIWCDKDVVEKTTTIPFVATFLPEIYYDWSHGDRRENQEDDGAIHTG